MALWSVLGYNQLGFRSGVRARARARARVRPRPRVSIQIVGPGEWQVSDVLMSTIMG